MQHRFASLLLAIAISVAWIGQTAMRSVLGNEPGRLNNDEAIAVILRLEKEWLQAMKSRDIAWFERNFASDCTEINSGNGQLKTKDQDIADFKTDKTVFETVEFADLRARVDGPAAVANGITHVVGHDEQGQKFDVRLAFTDTYILREGRWQVWAAQHTRVRP